MSVELKILLMTRGLMDRVKPRSSWIRHSGQEICAEMRHLRMQLCIEQPITSTRPEPSTSETGQRAEGQDQHHHRWPSLPGGVEAALRDEYQAYRMRLSIWVRHGVAAWR